MQKHLNRLKKKLSFSSRNQQERTSSPTSVATTLEDVKAPTEIVIVGAGIVGLVLALALNKHLGIQAEVYEQAQAFHDDVGAGMGMYPNGLRVIRDVDPELLDQIKSVGHPYVYRRWEVRDLLLCFPFHDPLGCHHTIKLSLPTTHSLTNIICSCTK